MGRAVPSTGGRIPANAGPLLCASDGNPENSGPMADD
jgi:hypothetical protein